MNLPFYNAQKKMHQETMMSKALVVQISPDAINRYFEAAELDEKQKRLFMGILADQQGGVADRQYPKLSKWCAVPSPKERPSALATRRSVHLPIESVAQEAGANLLKTSNKEQEKRSKLS